jgi:O2-independent ubiquinone biosynthesis accessory factor UbiT
MSNTRSVPRIPPFSPMLFTGLALRPLPPMLLSHLINFFLKQVERQTPNISNRLQPLGKCRFHIIPTDFWFTFLLTLDNGKATAQVLRNEQAVLNATATISGDLLSFVKLLEGSVDGDALFFSRRLIVEGDTEAALTLRNAVDSADLSIKTILAESSGFMKPFIRGAITRLASLHQTAHKDFEVIQGSIVDPFTSKIFQLDEAIERQEKQLTQQGREIRKLQTARNRSSAITGRD